MKKSLVPVTFYLLIGVFVVVVGVLIISGFSPVFRSYVSPAFMIVSWLIFFLLGVALIFFTVREKVEGKLQKFLILTGASAAGFLVSVLLHNFLYGLGIVIGHIILLNYLIETLHILFFFIAVFVCPSGFLIGVVGSIVLFIKKRKGS